MSSQLYSVFRCLLKPNNRTLTKILQGSNQWRRGYSTEKEMIAVTFITHEGERIATSGKEGDSLLDVVNNNNLNFNGYGSCDGTVACSTCHVILKKEHYDKVTVSTTEEEELLETAVDYTSGCSRLGCQITLTKQLEGLEAQLPSQIIDARELDP